MRGKLPTKHANLVGIYPTRISPYYDNNYNFSKAMMVYLISSPGLTAAICSTDY